MIAPLYTPNVGKMRVVALVSGSGNSLWATLDLQEEMEKTPEGCPFEIVGLFSSNKKATALDVAEKRGIPCQCLDIQEFCAQMGIPIGDMEGRSRYDQEILKRIESWRADILLLSGYVYLVTGRILSQYPVVGVHPADLTHRDEQGRRLLAGTDSIRAALSMKRPSLRATSYLANHLADEGPVLFLSQEVPVDYSSNQVLEKEYYTYLTKVNQQGAQTAARTILEIAQGNIGLDDNQRAYFRRKAIPDGVPIRSWQENIPLFRREIKALLAPRSVAVLGASQKFGIGRSIVENLLASNPDGLIYAVNTRGEDVGKAKGYQKVGDIPGPLDMAVLAVPSSAAVALAEECGQKGVKVLVCITAGFREVGGEGIEREHKLMEIVNRYNMRMIGPNCMGLCCSRSNLDATIITGAIPQGSVALVTQSGAIGAALLDSASHLNIGFSAIISLGNQPDVNACDVLPLLEEDPNTKVILLYMEGILEADRLLRILQKMTKPVLVIKSGRTAAGANATSSHTGSLAGDDSITQAYLEKAGVIRMTSLEEAFLTVSVLSRVPQVEGNRVGVITNAGGPGSLIVDALSERGFVLPQLSLQEQEALRKQLLKEASVQNPIDLVAPAAPCHYGAALQALLDSGRYDALVFCCVPPATVDTRQVAQAAIPILKKARIPYVTAFFGPTISEGGRAAMKEAGLPVLEYPEQTAWVLSKMRKRSPQPIPQVSRRAATLLQAKEILSKTPAGAYLPSEDAYRLLDCFGIQHAQSKVVTCWEELDRLSLCYPVVAKIEHPQILHKSDVGGVVTGIQGKEELRKTVTALLNRFPGATGVLVQEMLPAGTEIIIGSIADGVCGSAVMVGAGGVLVEIMEDVKFLYPPFDHQTARDAILSLRVSRLLNGYRGRPKADLDRLAQLLTQVGDMLAMLPQLAELDLNPVLYDHRRNAFLPVDIRIRKAE